MLIAFGHDIWLADGARITAAAGFHYPTRMAVIRLADGGLMVWSPIALDPALAEAVSDVGPVRHIIAPNSLHDTWTADWCAAFPDALAYAAPDLAAKRADIPFHDTLGDTAPAAWAGQVDQVVVAGNAITTEVVFFHRPSGTALFADLLQQLPRDWYSGWRAVVARLDGMTGPEPQVPRKFRLAFTKRRAARAALGRILEWPCTQVVMAHGAPVRSDGAVFLRQAFRWLVR